MHPRPPSGRRRRHPVLFHAPPDGGEPASGADGRALALPPSRRCARSSSPTSWSRRSTVSVAWDGAGAEDVDAAIVQLLEPALLAVDGRDRDLGAVERGPRPHRPRVRARLGHDARRRRRAGCRRLPSATCPRTPTSREVRRACWRDRVTDVVITGPVAVDQLARFADEFVVRLFAEGVTRTTIRASPRPRSVVEVTALSLVRHDVTMGEIADAIAAEAAADPAGDVARHGAGPHRGREAVGRRDRGRSCCARASMARR